MSKTKPWLKLWTEVRTDQKLRRIDPAWRWAWIGLLCLARENSEDGQLSVLDDPMTDFEIADSVGVSMEVWQQAKAYFVRMDMLTLDGDTLVIVNFSKRQAPDDATNAERQRRYKERHLAQGNGVSNAVSNGNGNGVSNAQEYRVQSPEEQNPESRESMNNREIPVYGSANGNGASTVDPLSFLSVIGFRNPEPFLDNVDRTLVALWAWYYMHLSDTQRRAVRDWPALVNAKVREGRQPRVTDELKTAFYKTWQQ